MTKMTGYPNLNLGLIGNCSFGALIDMQGRYVWCCLPRFDSTPVFHALLGDDPSPQDNTFAIEIDDYHRSEQEYVPNTAILKTRLYDAQGNGIEITDFAPRFIERGRTFRPQAMLRRVRPLNGSVRIKVIMAPSSNWGKGTCQTTHGSNHVRYVMEHHVVRLTTDAPIDYVLNRTPFLLNHEMVFYLGPDETPTLSMGQLASEFEAKTAQYWRTWTRRLALPLDYQEAVIRSAITLKMCVYEDTGAIIAAMTTSIPEAPHTERNWDYRYCWLRDAFFVIRALNRLAEVGTMEDHLGWIMNVVGTMDDSRLQPVFGIGMETELTEHIESQMPGYRGMGPVRRGNQAHEHYQHDVYGNVIMAASQAFFDHRLFRRPDIADFKRLEVLGERALKMAREPDAGMWELRHRARIHTSSSLMCWAAADRLGKIAAFLGENERAQYWFGHAAKIRDMILNESWCEERGAFAESFGGRELDASVLLMAEVGLIDARDPRFVSTVLKLEEVLADGPHMRRYEASDDFGQPEVGFTVCAFWRLDALAQIGETERAKEVFEALLASRNHLGLLSEDVHPQTGELWGNFPQTYSMVGIINGATRLTRPWDAMV